MISTQHSAWEVAIVSKRQFADSIKADFSLKWGVATKDGYQKKKLIDLSTDHLENILVTEPQALPEIKRTIIEILKERYGRTK